MKCDAFSTHREDATGVRLLSESFCVLSMYEHLIWTIETEDLCYYTLVGTLRPPLDCHKRWISLPTIFLVGALGVCDHEKAEALILGVHLQVRFHFQTVSYSIMPRAPVASELWKLSALDVHVLDRTCHRGCFFPFWQSRRIMIAIIYEQGPHRPVISSWVILRQAW